MKRNFLFPIFIALALLLVPYAAKADITYVGASAAMDGQASGAADPVATLPAGTQADDILLIHSWTRSTSDTTTVTGFTEIEQVDTGTGSHWWFWKRHDGSETDATCNRTNTTGDSFCRMFAFRGVVTSGDPWNALGTAAADNGTGDPTSHTAISTGAANSMVVVFIGYEDNDSSIGVMTGTDPSAYTEIFDEDGAGTDGMITIGYAVRTDAGSTGTISYDYGTLTSRTDDEGSLVLSLEPAPSVTAPTVSSVAATDVGYNSALVKATVDNANGDPTDTCGFAWGTNSTLSNGDTATTSDSTCPGDTGAFNKTLSNLSAGITYYFRAYAINSAGTGLASSILNFTTGAFQAAGQPRFLRLGTLLLLRGTLIIN